MANAARVPSAILQWVLAIGLLATVNLADASVTNSIACNFLAISNALVNVGEGDEIDVQAGECIWESPITLSGGKSFYFRGAGTNSVKLCGTNNGTWSLWIQKSGASPTEISGFRFFGYTNQTDGWILHGGNSFNGSGLLHVYSCVFTNVSKRGLQLGNGGAPALVEFCSFWTTGNDGFNPLRLEGDQAHSFTNASFLGTTNVVCVERCYFFTGPNKGNGFWDTYSGNVACIRYNFFDGQATSGTHGYDSGDNSPRHFEYYCNTFTNGQAGSPLMEIRGGTGVMFSNTVYGWQDFAQLACFRCCLADHTSTGHGQLDGATTNVLDGNIDGTGYPGHQQVGVLRSFDATSYSAFGVAINYQELYPVFNWSNVLAGTNVKLTVQGPYACGNQITNIIKLNRDYFDGVVATNYTPLVFPHPLSIAPATGEGGGTGGGVRGARGFYRIKLRGK